MIVRAGPSPSFPALSLRLSDGSVCFLHRTPFGVLPPLLSTPLTTQRRTPDVSRGARTPPPWRGGEPGEDPPRRVGTGAAVAGERQETLRGPRSAGAEHEGKRQGDRTERSAGGEGVAMGEAWD